MNRAFDRRTLLMFVFGRIERIGLRIDAFPLPEIHVDFEFLDN